MINPQLQTAAARLGIHFMGQSNLDFQKPNVMLRETAEGFACDAQPTLVTVSNSGIPAFMSTYVDPKLIEILVSPMKAAEVVGSEVKRGDWTMDTTMFSVIESTGETSSYGDYAESGQAGANVNFPQRQSYHYQVITQWGERELEREGLAKVDWANRLNIASVLTLNKFQNRSYFFGISGLQNYGLLNDPALTAPISPGIKNGGGTSWASTTTTADEVLNDISLLYAQLQTQVNGLVELDTKMTLAMSPVAEVALTKTTQFNVNVQDLLKKNYPNMTTKTAPEYGTTAGQLVQLIADNVEGQQTAEVAFTEKLRAHPIVVGMSNFRQKKSQGTWGCIIYRPVFIGQMLGV